MEEKFIAVRLMFNKPAGRKQKMDKIAQTENRRVFLKKLSFAALAAPFLIGCKNISADNSSDILTLIKKNAAPAGAEGRGAIDAPDNVSWKTVLAKKSDKDEKMIISGTVYKSNGKTPAPDILIYFYHTDREGYYGRGKSEPKHGHFRGWLLTDAKGRYEFTSIKPAAYPNRTFAAHVHLTITGKDFKEDSVDSILFEGDKFITEQERNEAGKKGDFNPLLRLEKDADGILRGTRNIQLWQI